MSHRANTLGKGMNSTGIFNFGIVNGLEGTLWIQTNCRPGEGWAPPVYPCPKTHYLYSTPTTRAVRGITINVNKRQNQISHLFFKNYLITNDQLLND